jgi:hypothetical protein
LVFRWVLELLIASKNTLALGLHGGLLDESLKLHAQIVYLLNGFEL